MDSDLTGKKVVGTIYEKESQKTNGKKLYGKPKGYDSFTSWIDKK